MSGSFQVLSKSAFRRVESEHQLKLAGRTGWNPVRLFARGCLRTEVQVDRSVRVLLHFGTVRRAAGAIHVLDKRMGLPVVGCRRPVLLDRRMGERSDGKSSRRRSFRRPCPYSRSGRTVRRAEPLDADVGITVGETTRVDWIPVGLGKAGPCRLDEFGRSWKGPVRALERYARFPP